MWAIRLHNYLFAAQNAGLEVGVGLSVGVPREPGPQLSQQSNSSQLSSSPESGLMAHPFPWVDLSLVSPKRTHRITQNPLTHPSNLLRELALICKRWTGHRSPHKDLPSKTRVFDLWVVTPVCQCEGQVILSHEAT